MDRNKRPALTSPWKIGFLVSLLLVTVSIGAGYAITRTFGITWSWLHIGGNSLAFDQDAFLREMAPLVALVALMALIAYFVITGAVRRYRSYLDSGLDYKNLIQSIQNIDDLNEDKIKSIGDYPELKQFLLKIKGRFSEREKSLDEREATLIARDGQMTAADNFKADAGVLLGAINKGAGAGFNKELGLVSDEMKQIEQAIRTHVQSGAWNAGPADGVPSMAAVGGEQLAALKDELTASAHSLKATVYDISAEMVASQNGAREIEVYLDQLRAACAQSAGAGDGGAGAGAAALCDRMDQVSAALGALGEETKGMAINAALQAGSGNAGAAELVKLADDVRDTAARFGGIAAQYQELGQQIRTAVQPQPSGGSAGAVDESVEALSGKVTFWVERSVVLSDKLNALEKQLAETVTAIDTRLGGDPGGASYQDVDVPDLAIEGNGAQFVPEEQAGAGVEPAGAGETPDTEPAAGIEQDTDLFEEIGGKTNDDMFDKTATMSPVKPTDDMFEEIQPGSKVDESKPRRAEPGELVQSQVDLSEEAANEDAAAGDDSPPAGPKEYVIEPDTPPVDTALEIESHRHEVPPAQAPAEPAADTPEPDTPAAPAEESHGEPVYDLYELGAVDYEPSVHQNV